jgi:putative ABC transport system ATP-binding protein
MMGGVNVALREVSRSYLVGSQPIQALFRLTLTIPSGQMVAVTGPSGSGKSTLLHLLGGMDRPDHGDIHVGEHHVNTLRGAALNNYRRSIGFVFQAFHLLPAMTALDNVAAPVLPRRVPYDKTQRARELLADVGLTGRESSLPSQLSGGQQQRVAIARALINQPALLLADEPTGNLDSSTGAGILDLLTQLQRERGMTVIIATHDQLVANRCDSVIELADGCLART